MKISRLFLSNPKVRGSLLLSAAVITLGFLLLGGSFGARILGALIGILIGLLLKVTAELFSLTQRLDGEMHLASIDRQSALTELDSTRSQIQAIHDRLRRHDAILLVAERRRTESRRKVEARFEELEEELRSFKSVADRASGPGPAHRHTVTGAGAMDELRLGDALSGLTVRDIGNDG